MFEIIEGFAKKRLVIKVVGIGGAGGHVIDMMLQRAVSSVKNIAADLEILTPRRNKARNKLSLSQTGQVSGAKTKIGKEAAKEARDQICAALEGSDIVFITAGMGGRTGTGAAPVVAKIAHEMGSLTIGVVTTPLIIKGGKRMKLAEAGIAKLSKHVDSLIVIRSDALLQVVGDDADVEDRFNAANRLMNHLICGIAQIFDAPGLVNIDVEDARAVLTNAVHAQVGLAEATGIFRARVAAKDAIYSLLVNGGDPVHAKGVLVVIHATQNTLRVKEVNEVMNEVRAAVAHDAHIVFGAVYDAQLNDALRVTVLVTLERPVTGGPGKRAGGSSHHKSASHLDS